MSVPKDDHATFGKGNKTLKDIVIPMKVQKRQEQYNVNALVSGKSVSVTGRVLFHFGNVLYLASSSKPVYYYIQIPPGTPQMEENALVLFADLRFKSYKLNV